MKRLFILFVFAILLLNGCGRNPNNYSQLAQVAQGVTPDLAYAPKHIALLLPLTGPLSPYAQAIKNGFFTAFYDQKQRLNIAPTISVYDTNGKDINQVYATAVSEGADFVVGPLEKNAVQTLAQNDHLSVPVLALNTTQTSDRRERNLYEFGLSPRDEAQQAANQIWKDQKQRVLVIVPDNELGQRMANAFDTQFQGLGGKIIATQFYDKPRTLADSIQQVLQVHQAYEDKHAIQRIIHQSVRFIPQRRKDFDSIFLVATPSIAEQVLPLLRFYFAGDIPVYATAQLDTGHAFSNELDGVFFCDMPWILAPNQMQPTYLQTIQQRIQSVWPNQYARLVKFYALGVDAFHLTWPLNQWRGLPRYGMPAATGTLYLTTQQHIYRQLTWAKIQNGAAQLVH